MTLADRLTSQVSGWAREHGPGLVVGLSGPQGAGKSTVAREMAGRLAREGLRAALLSLDDLYLPRRHREGLAREVHPLFATRGPPGTHDVAQGEALLDALRRPGEVRLPRFDKAVDDRRAEPLVLSGPVDVVLFDGWCVGVRAQPAALLRQPVNALECDEDADGRWRTEVNAQLAGAYSRLWARLDRLIVLTAPSWATVVRWRTGAEADNGAMGPTQLTRFLQHYERLTRWAARDAPKRADLHVALAEDRAPA